MLSTDEVREHLARHCLRIASGRTFNKKGKLVHDMVAVRKPIPMQAMQNFLKLN